MSDYIKKLYELAGIENYSIKNMRGFIPNEYKCIVDENDYVLDIVIDFTAEKQLELIKWLGKLEEHLEIGIEYQKRNELWCISLRETAVICPYYDDLKNWQHHKHFDQALAGLILDIWQDLTDDQKQEIKNILDTTKN